MTIIVDSNRKKPAGGVATASEAEALFRSMVAYSGTYSVRGYQVIHRPDASWNEAWTGTDQGARLQVRWWSSESRDGGFTESVYRQDECAHSCLGEH